MPAILLVEDTTSNVSLLEDVFSYDDIRAQLSCVASGEEALRLTVLLQPVLILMDLRLPGIDGLETTEILKRHPLTKNIPVWAITAYAMPGDEERARAAGCDEYFTKPLSVRMLADRLRSFLQGLEKAEGREYASTQSNDR
jgi:two-component system, cell cycle response regulator DivK